MSNFFFNGGSEFESSEVLNGAEEKSIASWESLMLDIAANTK